MEILIIALGFVAIVALFDLAAVGFGVDSRMFSSDRHAPVQDLSTH